MILKIGLDEVHKSPVIGSLIVAMVVVDSNFFRRFSSLKIMDSCTREKRDKIVNLTKKYIEHLHIEKIIPQQMETESLNDLEIKAMINCLNSYPEFWKHDVYIDNLEHTKEKFLLKFNKFLPHNLKNIDLKTDSWIIVHQCDKLHKACSLASIFAKSCSDLEFDELRNIWGEIGSGSLSDPRTLKFIIENPDCPHIRNWITKRLKENPELKKTLLEKINNKTYKPQDLKDLWERI